MMKTYWEDLTMTIKLMDKEPVGKLLNALESLQRIGGRLFIIGIGGSAANATHAAADFRKLANIEAYSMDNVAEITARSNDEGFYTIFEEWLKGSRLSFNDMILVLSVGGGNMEENVSTGLIKALDYAAEVGARTVGIVGKEGGYTKEAADICITIPQINEYLVTPFAETMQVAIWHLLVFHASLNQNLGKWESIALK